MLLIKLQMYTKKKKNKNFHITFYLPTKKGLQNDMTLNFFIKTFHYKKQICN